MDNVTDQLPSDMALVHSLASKTCPACSGKKQRSHTFCGRCYHGLTSEARLALYRRLGRGYREAVAVAMQLLGRTTFVMPTEER